MKLRNILFLALGLAACGDNISPGPQLVDSNFSGTVAEDGSITVTIEVLDPDAMTFTASAPAHGTLSGTGPTFVYRPEPEFSGTDSFIVTVSDGVKSVQVPVAIRVTAVDDAPVVADDSFSTPEDTALTFPTSALLANDHDIDSTNLTVMAVTQPATAVCASPGGCGDPSVVLADGTITYQPPYNFHGDQTFQYTVSDGELSTTGVVTITVGAVNDAPIAFGDAVQAQEDAALSVPMADLLANDYDADGDTPMIIAVDDATHGSVAIDGTNVVFTPDAEYSGDASFTYTISDGSEQSTASVAVTVASVDDAPAVADASLTVHMNGSAQFTLAGTDIDSPSLTFAIVTPPAHGTVQGTSPTFTYTPDLLYAGSDSFTFAASDGTSTSAPATMSVTVDPETALIRYTFEGSGATVPNLGTLGIDGTLESAASQGGAGVCGAALLSDGSGASRVNTGWNLDLPASWTVSFWSGGDHTASFYVVGSTGPSFRVFTNGVAGTGNWIIRGSGITDTFINGGANGQTHMMTWVYEATANTITGYLDGVQVSSVLQPSHTALAGSPLTIGSYNGSVGLSNAAWMDDVRVYGEALTGADVMAMYTSSQSCPAP